ncbi:MULTISPECIES: YtxH domain-containing protein [unclassified Parvimonas]|uniref:YtxH domain-containing protein n=1 Tax=unclassified Parvimonas TaxID=1151464 RepID=UPI00021D325C|nr:hypothetical protein HMPREF9127_0198 [Parvimonas sp. oral taxon 393 str. F0440]
MSLAKYIEQRRLEREREVRRKIRKEKLSNAAKITVGAAVGAGIGILFAPKSGKETREDIVKATKDGVEYVSENVNNAVKVVADKAKEVKEAVEEKYDDFTNRNMTEISPEVEEMDITESTEE